MAFTGITATEAQIDQKSGVNVNALFTDTMKTVSLLFWENSLNAETEFNWSDAFGSLNADVKGAVTAYTASGVAMEAINYDIDAHGRGTANMMVNVLLNIMDAAMKTLKESNKRSFMVKVT